MKETETKVVFYNAEKDGFLKKYEDRGTLAFKVILDDDFRDALSLPLKDYEKQKCVSDKLAETFSCEVLIVETEYNVTRLDGSGFERTEID